MKKIACAAAGLAALALIVAGAAACRGRAPAEAGRTARVVDLVGREVRVVPDVRRIVLLRSKDIYLLAALLGEELPARLAAWGPDLKIDDAQLYQRLLERFPSMAKLTVTGDVYSDGLDIEQLVSLHPDLVISDKFMRTRKYAQRLEASGLPVLYLDGSDDPLTGPQAGLRLLGAVLNRAERAKEITTFMDAQIRLATSRIASNAPSAPSVYLEAGNLGPGGYGQCYGAVGTERAQTSWGAILRALRVRNIAENRVVGMAPIAPEALLAADPDIVVITGQNWSRFGSPGAMRLGFNVNADEARGLLRGFTERPGWNLLAAVRNRRVYAVFHNTVSPAIFFGVQTLAKDFYPDLFADVAPEKNLKAFFEKFMPVPCEGTWACALE